jgi:hypothetical protein
MNQFFVKNKQIAFSLDNDAKEAKKFIFDCCVGCSNPVALSKGYVVKTSMTKSQLQKVGVLVSSSVNTTGH